MSLMTKEEIFEWIHPIEDPELFMSLVDLGLIYDAKHFEDNHVEVSMTLTSPGCPAGDYMIAEIKKRIKEKEFVTDVIVSIVWEPKWDPKEMASDEVKDQLGIW